MESETEPHYPSGITVRNQKNPWRNFMTGLTLTVAGAGGGVVNGCVEQNAKENYKKQVIEKITDSRTDEEIAASRVDELRKQENFVPPHAIERGLFDNALADAQEKRQAGRQLAAAAANDRHSLGLAGLKGAGTGLGMGAAGIGAAILGSSLRRRLRGKKYGKHGITIDMPEQSHISTIDMSADGEDLYLNYRPEYKLSQTAAHAGFAVDVYCNYDHTRESEHRRKFPLHGWPEDMEHSKHFALLDNFVRSEVLTYDQMRDLKQIFREMAAEYREQHAATAPALAR